MKVQVGCGVLMRQVSRRSQVWSSDGAGDEGAGGVWGSDAPGCQSAAGRGGLMRQGVKARLGVEL